MERMRDEERARHWGLERWTVFNGAETCSGCAYLDGRIFFAGEGPYPTLHITCRCGRLPVDLTGISGVALMRLVLEARKNGREADALLAEAHRRRGEPTVDVPRPVSPSDQRRGA